MRKKTSLLCISSTFVLSLVFLMTGCNNYYKAISTPVETNAQKITTIEMLKNNGRVFILRNGDEAFLINDPVTSKEKNTVECTLDTLSSLNKLHLGMGRKGKMQYKKKIPTDSLVLNEVHVYVDSNTNTRIGRSSISLEQINKIEFIKKDTERSASSHVLGTIGIIAGLGLAAIIIFIATFKPVE